MSEKISLTSIDIAESKQQQLKQIFPEIFCEDKIDFDQLKRVLGEWVEPNKERFGLNWPGKAECMKVIQQLSLGTLKPCRAESVNFDETENVFIEGNNLEVLKLLQKAYFGKVKMIYIDPPYNTGNDFIYPDDYKEPLENYFRITGQSDNKGRKFSTNSEKAGRYHSNWLNMMYPRLYIARQLLRDDGVIFISIDDHEVANLRALCNQVFGEENFVAELVWRRRASSAMANNSVSVDHEYVIAYQKGNMVNFRGDKKDYQKYKNPDNDPRGPWIADNLTVGMNASMRPNQAYDLVDTKTGKVYPYNPNRVWAYIPESMDKMIKEGRVLFPKNTSQRPMQKRFKNELKSDMNPFSTIMIDKVGLNTEGTKIIQHILDGNVFDYAKPLSFLKIIIEQVTRADDIILDFFSGSGTSAHAVMQQNAEDDGNRKYICVQIPELCDEKSEAYKVGYKTIADIAKERIRRAAKKIEEESPDKAKNVDLGFKVFKLDESNFKIWNNDLDDFKKNPAGQLELSIDHINSNSSSEDILYEILLKDGFPLTTKIEKKQFAGKDVYSIENDTMLICLTKQITSQLIDAMAAANPSRIICFDVGFKGNDQLKVNAVQTFKSLAQQQGREIVFKTV